MTAFAELHPHCVAMLLRIVFRQVLGHEVCRIKLAVNFSEGHLLFCTYLLNPQVARVYMSELSKASPRYYAERCGGIRSYFSMHCYAVVLHEAHETKAFGCSFNACVQLGFC